MNPEAGTLYIVGTPIGNLSDFTRRAKDVLDKVKVVVCEDTRRTSKLLNAIGASCGTVSCFKDKEVRCAMEVLEILQSGTDCAFLTDAGTPNVSDPGRRLIEAAFHGGIRVVPIPGASAVTTILSCSPFSGDSFFFAGFLPERAARRREFLKDLAHMACPIVFFEAPHRVRAGLRDVLEVLGDRRILMGRELTKLHEELALGKVSEILDGFEDKAPRGEFTFCLEGAKKSKALRPEKGRVKEALKALVEALEQGTLHTKELSKIVSRLTGLPANEVYGMLLSIKAND